MSQPASTLSDLTPFEQRLVRAWRYLDALRPSRRAVATIVVTFALNLVGMAASSGSRMGLSTLLAISALQAAVVTAICIAPAILAYALGLTRRVHHRWAMLAAVFLVVGSLAARM